MSELGPGATGLPLSPAGSAPGQGPSNESASGHRLGLGQVGDVVFSVRHKRPSTEVLEVARPRSLTMVFYLIASL
jgi:hypothetical protein